MVDGDVGIHRLLHKGDDVGGRDPRGAKPRRDVGWTKVGRLDAPERLDIARIGRIERRGGFRCSKLRADRTGEIGVGCVPRAGCGIAEDGVAEFTDHVVDAAVQKLRDVIGIDRASLVQDDGECVGG